MPTDIALDERWTVNETIARHPATIAVFNRFGIDSCCGGVASIAEAARREGIDAATLLEAVRLAAGVA